MIIVESWIKMIIKIIIQINIFSVLTIKIITVIYLSIQSLECLSNTIVLYLTFKGTLCKELYLSLIITKYFEIWYDTIFLSHDMMAVDCCSI